MNCVPSLSSPFLFRKLYLLIEKKVFIVLFSLNCHGDQIVLSRADNKDRTV